MEADLSPGQGRGPDAALLPTTALSCTPCGKPFRAGAWAVRQGHAGGRWLGRAQARGSLQAVQGVLLCGDILLGAKASAGYRRDRVCFGRLLGGGRTGIGTLGAESSARGPRHGSESLRGFMWARLGRNETDAPPTSQRDRVIHARSQPKCEPTGRVGKEGLERRMSS